MNNTFWIGSDSKSFKNKFVGMFDILGFKNIVNNTSPEKLLENYKYLLQQKREASSIPEFITKGLNTEQKIWKVPIAVFSDTILLWSNDSKNGLDIFLSTCSSLISKSINMGWPIRGGISYGKCYLNRRSRIFVGPPIVNAYEIEQCQEWIGASLHKSCFTEKKYSDFIMNHHNVVKYNVPVKCCSPALNYAINWKGRIYDAKTSIENLMSQQPKKYRKKYRNTLLFC